MLHECMIVGNYELNHMNRVKSDATPDQIRFGMHTLMQPLSLIRFGLHTPLCCLFQGKLD
jgi:hypothetical protein